jgi:outer membrane protein
MKRLIIISLALAFPLLSHAQEEEAGPDLSHPWSLRECVEYAMDHNLNIKQRENNLEREQLQLSTDKFSRLPDLSAGASQNFSFGRGLTEDNTYAHTNTASTSFSLGSGVNLFSGFRTMHTIKLDELNLAAATADLQKAKDDIRVAVAQAYVQILYDIEILQVARNQIDIDTHQVERIKAMRATGKASDVEVSQQEAALQRSILTATQAENNLRMARLDLSQLLELPSPEGLDVIVPEVEPETLPLESPEDIYLEAVGIRPAVKAEENRLAGAERSIKIAQSAMYPSLSLSGGIGTNYYNSKGMSSVGFWDQLNNNFSQYVGLSLNIPIFNRLSTRNNIRSANIAKANQEIQLENVKKSLYKEIQQAWYNAVSSRQKYISSRSSSESSEESFNLVSVKYENGKANITEFNEAKSQYMEARSNLAQARYEYLYQMKLLDFYKGEELSF